MLFTEPLLLYMPDITAGETGKQPGHGHIVSVIVQKPGKVFVKCIINL